jgi:hypothetical protein
VGQKTDDKGWNYYEHPRFARKCNQVISIYGKESLDFVDDKKMAFLKNHIGLK